MKERFFQPGGTASLYICITPRNKLKALRDYAGFSSVKRYPLPKVRSAAEPRGKLVGRKTEERKKQEDRRCDNHHPTNFSPPGYMFVCNKNNEYQVGVSKPFAIVGNNHNNHKNHDNPVNDETECPTCKQTFREFRKDENLEFRGAIFWSRKFKAHRIHCKSDPVRV